MFKGFLAESAIGKNRICRFGTVDGAVVLATGAADKSIGVSDGAGDAVAGDVVDIKLLGLHEVVLGAAVTRGDPLTSDANGAAIAAAPRAGVNAYTIGRALVSGVAGDIIAYCAVPGVIQG